MDYCMALKCPCGGTVDQLIDDTFYTVTDDDKIIFRGLCNVCGDPVQTKRDIVSLLAICAASKEKRVN